MQFAYVPLILNIACCASVPASEIAAVSVEPTGSLKESRNAGLLLSVGLEAVGVIVAVGAAVSMTMFLFAPSECRAPGCGSRNELS